ncbi:MAG: TIGR02647 family protein [Methylovulum sp.]|uniref:TIGR02647 family protein n=1 Tax=Methylovulum sp. TaxID=1916980 RepID=UPI002622E7BF|nr:TIGR02647 family protein [Methylovulum sp.]MDD2724349.1 TIGR02647 family protein [Methylovulum sp.]MDD5124802.1 TIGR02647 family protein [Methylovulum sp.]
MNYNQEMIDELNLLALYNLDSTLAGLKIHTSSATPSAVAAAHRLHAKGLTTREDGGYLTTMGHEAAEMAQTLFHLINPA